MLTNMPWGAPANGTDILDAIRKARLLMPPIETWCSTKMVPEPQHAIRLEASGENFLIGHPDLWRRLPAQTNPGTLGNSLSGGIKIIDIDLDDELSDEARRYREGIWLRLAEAYLIASTELPDWLRSTIRFGTHG